MIFAAATDEQTLLVFPTPEKAVAYCEGIDVEAGTWLFWSEQGLPLRADFLVPNHHGRFSVSSGIYRLIPAQAGGALLEAVDSLRTLEPNPFFPSLAAVRAHLAGTAPIAQDGA